MALVHIVEINRGREAVAVRVAMHIPVKDPAARDVLASRQTASAVRDITEDEMNALQTGCLLEVVRVVRTVPEAGEGEIKRTLEAAYGRIAEYVLGRLLSVAACDGRLAGAKWDGSQWSK